MTSALIPASVLPVVLAASISFAAPFPEQVDFFKRKLNLPTQTWEDMLGAAHDHAFVVAGAMQADLLSDLRGAVDAAITEGETLTQFRKRFDEIVSKHGWDHTGSRNWRSQVIYQTNLRTSYAAGRWAQLTDPEMLAVRPYWRYVHSDAVLNPRPWHLAWDGLIIDANDPWWLTHYPPNGWGCMCRVFAVAADELPDYDKTAPDKAPTKPNDTTGIDKGWDYAPGASAAARVRALQSSANRIAQSKAQGLAASDATIAKDFVHLLVNAPVFERWYAALEARVETLRPQLAGKSEKTAIQFLRDEISDGGTWPLAVLSGEAKGWLGTEASLVLLSKDTVVKQIFKRGEITGLAQYRMVQDLLDNAQIVILEGDLHLVYFRQNGTLYEAVIKATRDKSALFLVSMHESRARDIDSAKKKGRVLRDLLE